MTVKELSKILATLDPDSTVLVSLVYDRYPNIPRSQRPLQSECSCVVNDPAAFAVIVHGRPTGGR